MQLTTSIKTNFGASGSKVLDDRTATDPINLVQTTNLANGSGNNQANQSFHDQRTLTTGASEDVDLAGSLVDAFGDTITFTALKAIRIRNQSAVNRLIVGGAVANALAALFGALTDKLIIRPSGLLVLEAPLAGYAVVAATGDLLKFEHGAEDSANLIYELTLVGTV